MPELAVGYFRVTMGMDDEDFREPGHLRRGRMHVQVTEHPADGDLHSRRNF